jgi:nucleoside phosphorylase
MVHTAKIKRILIVCALKEEYQSTLYRVVYSGMGKVKACIALSKVDPSSYDIVINIGSCGSASFKAGELVKVQRFFEWDKNLPKSFQELGSDFIYDPDVLRGTFALADCYTGDSFMDAKGMKKDEPCVYDMEAYALAAWCLAMEKQFICFKFVTDSGSEEMWKDSLPHLSTIFNLTMEQIIDEILPPM